MFEQLLSKAQTVAAKRRTALIGRLANENPPPGVTVTRSDDGVVLSGKNLRSRLITDATLRNFGR